MIDDLRLLDMCAEVYSRDDPDWGDWRIRVFAYYEQGYLCIVPAGSRQLEDWWLDLHAMEVMPVILGGGTAWVTTPFWLDVATVIEGVVSEVDQACLPVIVAGHSKGGAEAQCIAAQLKRRGIVAAKLTTFESPRVGSMDGFLADVLGTDYAHLGDAVVDAPPLRDHPRPLTWFLDPALPENGDRLANHHLATAIRPALVKYLGAP